MSTSIIDIVNIDISGGTLYFRACERLNGFDICIGGEGRREGPDIYQDSQGGGAEGGGVEG